MKNARAYSSVTIIREKITANTAVPQKYVFSVWGWGKNMSLNKRMKNMTDSGRLRQVLGNGYLSSEEIQYVIDAVYEKLESKEEE